MAIASPSSNSIPLIVLVFVHSLVSTNAILEKDVKAACEKYFLM